MLTLKPTRAAIAASLLFALVAVLFGASTVCQAQTRIIIARHGAVTYDYANPVIRNGQQDPSLTAEGQQQAARLAELARAEGVTHIYHSPLTRGRETAEIVSRALKLQPIAVKGFAEIHLGDLEGKDLSQPPHRDQFSELLRDVGKKRPGGESFTEMHARATAALRDLIAKHPNQTILIIGHGVMNRTLVAMLRDITLKEAAGMQSQPNTRVYLANWNGKPPATVTTRDF
jgi:broad specificity phosphatase PhoE